MTAALQERLELEAQLALRRARRGLLAFTLHTKDDFRVNWHHRAICRTLVALDEGWTPRRLLASFGIAGAELARQLKAPHPVTGLYAGMTRPEMLDAPLRNVQFMLPPRHGKTEIVSRRFPPYLLGRHPDAQIIATSYGADLAQANNRDCQKIIDSPTYEEVFTQTRLYSSNVRSVARGAWLRNSDIFEIVGRRGVYKNAGVGGAITGRGADWACVDDPIRNRADAESPAIRETLWDWFQSTLYTRLERNGRIIVTNTRWHETDLSGKTLAKAQSDPNAEQYFCLVFPALLDCDPGPGDPRKHGEALWPWKAPVERLQRIRASTSVYEFESLFQQRPGPTEGGVIKEGWWKFYDALPEGLRHWAMSVDLSFEDRGDFNALLVWARKGADKYLVDMIHDRLDFTDQLAAFRSLHARYPQMRAKYVEKAANGAALIRTLRSEIGGIIAVTPEGSKRMRVDAVSPQIRAGNVWLPKPSAAPWVNKLLAEFRNFPNGAHDDICDAVSLYLSQTQDSAPKLGGARPMSATRSSYFLEGAATRRR